MTARKKVQAKAKTTKRAASAKSPARKKAATAKKKTSARKAPTGTELQTALERMNTLSERLERALDEVPRATDFEPLADHLYNFATLAPKLLESLEELPGIVSPIDASARSLRDSTEALQFAHESFSEALLRLPRAEDYEPLAAPLQEFAQVAPSLAESLSQVLKTTKPLNDAVAGLQQIADSMLAMQEGMASFAMGAMQPAQAAPAPGGADPAEGDGRRVLGQVAERVEQARDQILEALADLPHDAQYARVAARLRELAGDSEELTDWLGDARGLAAPLADAVSGLEAAATTLTNAHLKLTELLEGRYRQA